MTPMEEVPVPANGDTRLQPTLGLMLQAINELIRRENRRLLQSAPSQPSTGEPIL